MGLIISGAIKDLKIRGEVRWREGVVDILVQSSISGVFAVILLNLVLYIALSSLFVFI